MARSPATTRARSPSASRGSPTSSGSASPTACTIASSSASCSRSGSPRSTRSRRRAPASALHRARRGAKSRACSRRSNCPAAPRRRAPAVAPAVARPRRQALPRARRRRLARRLTALPGRPSQPPPSRYRCLGADGRRRADDSGRASVPSRSPAISVVIPTKNRHSMLAEAIASVLRQDFDDYEVLVVDDGVGAAEFVAEWFAGERCIRCAGNGRGGPSPGAQSRRVAGAGRDRRLPRRRRSLGLEFLSFGGVRGDRRAIRRDARLGRRRRRRRRHARSRNHPVCSFDQPRGDPLRQQDPRFRLRLFARAVRPSRRLRRDAADLLGLGLVFAPARRRRRLPRSRAAGGGRSPPTAAQLPARVIRAFAPTTSPRSAPNTGWDR